MVVLYAVMSLALLATLINVWVDPTFMQGSFVRDIDEYVQVGAVWSGLIQIQLVLIISFESMILVRDLITIEPREMKTKQKKRKRMFKIIIICVLAIDAIQLSLLIFYTYISNDPHDSEVYKIVLAVYLEFDAFFVGYFVLMALSWYWFRRKHCNNKRVLKTIIQFAWIFVMQCSFVTTNVLLSKYFENS